MGLPDWIERNAALHPDKAAIRFPGRADLSYAGLAAQIERLAAALAASGVERGGCAAFLGFNSPEMLALLFACARLGALFMPLNWRLAAPEHRQMLEDCTPAVIFAEASFIEQAESLCGAFPGTRFVALGGAGAGWTTDEDFLLRASAAAPRGAQIDPATPLLICYTSGSTGRPKGVLLSQSALEWNAANSADMHDLAADDIVLTTLPLFHVGGLNIQTTPALAAGCTVVLHAKFDADAAFDAIESSRVTLTVLVPAQLDMMMASPRWKSADLSSLRMISTGSTIVPERLIRAVHARGIPLAPVYGSTETCPIAAYLKAGEARRKAGTTGKAARHGGLRVADDSGRALAPGEVGEILVRGPQLMSGYWRAPEATQAALREGWFHSGDLGWLDDEGYLTVVGRKKDMIISGGENIYPAEIENVLLEHPDIAEVAVVGKADPRWGEVAVAVVVPKGGRALKAGQIAQCLEGRIARYKHPKEVVFVAQLPKTALGKVRKEEVRRLVDRETA